MGRNGKKGGNQHNAKHDGGIVAPGKRVTKQKSNGHLIPAGTAAPNNTNTVPKSKETDTCISSGSQPHPSVAQETSYAKNNAKSKISPSHSHNDSASEDVEELENMSGKTTEGSHRKIDVTTAKQSTAQDGSMPYLALTVLKSSPLADTMAILVILLSVPSAILHLTNTVFAMMTFVPPSGSFSTLPSLSDITSSFSPGAPSFVVLVAIDLIAICLWSIMPWPQLQTMLLDCAQATVATHLGGGYAFKSGASDNLLLAIGFVFATHMGRYRRTTLKWLHRTSLSRYLPAVEDLDDIPAKASYVLGPERTWFDTLKIYIALHILLQGLTRMVRRALNTPRDTLLVARSIDFDANSLYAEPSDNSPLAQPPSIKSKMSLQTLRETRDKVSSGKRRRKQANHARAQQPLWAAIAAIWVNIMREWEQSKAAKGAKGADTTSPQDLGNAPFVSAWNKIWITAIKPDKIFFETGPMQSSAGSGSRGTSDGIDAEVLPAFRIHVNGAVWASIKMLPIDVAKDSPSSSRWVGEIYGLAPTNTYRISFVRRDDGSELHSEIAVTPASATEEERASHTIPTQLLRPASPASPIATVKTSIASFEASVNDLLAMQKRMRKDSKATKAKFDKELENLQEKLARVLANTKTLSQKQNSLENSIKLIEEAILVLSEQIDEQGAVPEELTREWQQHKASWEQIRNELSRVQEDVQRTKEDNRASLATIQNKELSERQKRNRAQTRVKKLTTDFADLQAQAENPDHQRAKSAHAQRAAELDSKEAQALHQNDNLRRANQEVLHETQIIKNEIDYMEHIANQNNAFIAAQAQSQVRFAQDSRPITPEGDLPGTNAQVPGSGHSVSFSRPHQFNTQESGHAYKAGINNAFGNGLGYGGWQTHSSNNRHRSQSALSGGVIYAPQEEDDDDDDDPIPLMHKRRVGTAPVRDISDGRSSSSGSPHVSAGAVL